MAQSGNGGAGVGGSSPGLRADVHAAAREAAGPMLLKQYTLTALTSRGEKKEHVEYIKLQLRSEPHVQTRWLEGLAACVSSFGDDRVDIVESALAIDLGAAEPVYAGLADFLCNLVSVNTRFVTVVLTSLVRRFAKPAGSPGASTLAIDRTHLLIQSLLALAPSATTTLVRVFTDEFPHYAHELVVLEPFVRNVLVTVRYAPICRAPLVALVVDMLIRIDIECNLDQRGGDGDGDDADEYGGDDDGVDDGVLAGGSRDGGARDESSDEGSSARTRGQRSSSLGRLFAFDAEIGLGGDVGSGDAMGADALDEIGMFAADSDSHSALSDSELVHAHEMAFKLDALLVVLYEFLGAQSALSSEMAASLFALLVHLFDNAILRTAKCRHAQFLVFYLASLVPDAPDIFADYLLGVCKMDELPTSVRVAAASHLASFLARARYVKLATVKRAMVGMSLWLTGHLESFAASFDPAELGPHRVFFALAQGLFYTLCFHFEALVDEPGGRTWLDRLALGRIVASPLNPLRVCVGSVVDAFARLTFQHQLAYCYDIVQANAERHALHRFDRTARAQLAALQASFPYDEYSLPLSMRFVSPLFRVFGALVPGDRSSEADSSTGASFGFPVALSPSEGAVHTTAIAIGGRGRGRGATTTPTWTAESLSPGSTPVGMLLFSKLHSPPSPDTRPPFKRTRFLEAAAYSP